MVNQVGFIGLGRIGFHMAARIHRHTPVTVWNRSIDKSIEHAKLHNTKYVSEIEDFRNCKVVFCCLPTSSEVMKIAKRLVESKKRQEKEKEDNPDNSELKNVESVEMLVDCTSGNHKQTLEIGELLSKEGIRMVDCPVSGGPSGAEAGTLCAMVGSNNIEDAKLASEYVGQFARQIEYTGVLGSGHAIKCVNNLLNSAHLCAVTEALLGLEKIGVKPQDAIRCINVSSGRSLQSKVRIPVEVLSGKYHYGFDLQLMKKDCHLGQMLIEDQLGGCLFIGPNLGTTTESSTNQKDSDSENVVEHRTPIITAAKQIELACDYYKDVHTESPDKTVDYTYLSKYLEEKAGVSLQHA